VTEFALVVPVLMLLLIAIADFGRIYASAVAVEAAGREAADYGAFDASYWQTTSTPPNQPNYVTTVNEMQRRACVAAAGSHLEGYQTTDPVNNSTCTNPSFSCTLERNGATTDCMNPGGFVNGTDCSNPATDPPCTVHVQMTYTFQTFLSVPPMPTSVQLVRDSRFRISCLTVAGTPGCPS
jgi:Flp pilus assembly protein TadG